MNRLSAHTQRRTLRQAFDRLGQLLRRFEGLDLGQQLVGALRSPDRGAYMDGDSTARK